MNCQYLLLVHDVERESSWECSAYGPGEDFLPRGWGPPRERVHQSMTNHYALNGVPSTSVILMDSSQTSQMKSISEGLKRALTGSPVHSWSTYRECIFLKWDSWVCTVIMIKAANRHSVVIFNFCTSPQAPATQKKPKSLNAEHPKPRGPTSQKAIGRSSTSA